MNSNILKPYIFIQTYCHDISPIFTIYITCFLNIPNSPLQYSAFFLIFNNPEFNKFAIRYAIIYLFFHVYINYLISLQGFT